MIAIAQKLSEEGRSDAKNEEPDVLKEYREKYGLDLFIEISSRKIWQQNHIDNRQSDNRIIFLRDGGYIRMPVVIH